MKRILFILVFVLLLAGCTLDASLNGVDNSGQEIPGDNQPPVIEDNGNFDNGDVNDDNNNHIQPEDPNLISKKIDNLTISSLNEGYSKSGNDIIFTKAGEYIVSGSYSGSLVFSVDTLESVTIYLNNANIESVSNHTIYWTNTTGKIEIKAMEGTTNTITVKEDASNLFSAVESENNIEIGGSGKLTIKGLQRHAVKGSNIEVKGNVDLTVEAVKDGLHGKQIIISGGNTKINNCTDAIQAEINSNNAKGTILVEEGYLTINNCKRAFRATTSVTISVLANSNIIIYVYNTNTVIDCPTVNYVSGTFKVNGVDYK